MTSASHAEDCPLPSLLSQIYVALMIECDNETEQRLTYRTTREGGRGPWLTSGTMWFNCLRHLSEDPLPVSQLLRRARTPTNLNGMQRWGYIRVERVSGRGQGEWLVSATRAGLLARDEWARVIPEVETRWERRFGPVVGRLRGSLEHLSRSLPASLPDCMPILRYGLLTQVETTAPVSDGYDNNIERPPLAALLARALTASALTYERGEQRSLAASANVLRLARETVPVRLRDVPPLAGISPEATRMAVGQSLIRMDLVTLEPLPSPARGQALRLTAAGRRAQAQHLTVLRGIEEAWIADCGRRDIKTLRSAAERLALPDGPNSPLLQSLQVPDSVWRARVAPPAHLPHFPMVLHRGGFPDGA